MWKLIFRLTPGWLIRSRCAALNAAYLRVARRARRDEEDNPAAGPRPAFVDAFDPSGGWALWRNCEKCGAPYPACQYDNRERAELCRRCAVEAVGAGAGGGGVAVGAGAGRERGDNDGFVHLWRRQR